MSKDAKPDTWMPLVIGDYLKDTTRLTTEQHGAYLLLIMSYWVDGPPLNDDEDLAAITGLDRKAWLKNRPKLERFFRIEDGRWRHKRIDEELSRWAAKKEQYAARAAAGGRAKAAKSTLQAEFKQGKSGQNGCLKAAPQPASTEVDGPPGQSTLCERERPEARHEGASGLRVIDGRPDESERGWRLDAQRARQEATLCRRRDPDQSSELEEFAAYADGQAANLRRAAA